MAGEARNMCVVFIKDPVLTAVNASLDDVVYWVAI